MGVWLNQTPIFLIQNLNKTKHVILINSILILLLSSCNTKTKQNKNDVKIVGAMKNVMWKGELGSSGREARGVRGIRLKETGESVVAMIVADDEATLLLACENGYGKRTLVSEFPCKGRGAMGVIGIQTSDRNGAVVGAAQVIDDDDLLLITNGGTMVRTPCQDISVLGRNTQGVTLIRLTDGEQLVRVDAVAEPPVEPLSESDTDDGEIIDGSDVETDDESAD